MNGQWIGEYESLLEGQTFGGKIHLNIDDRVDHFQGVAYLFEDPQSPVSIAAFRTSNKDRQFRFRTLGIAAYDYSSMGIVEWESIKNKYPAGILFAKWADVEGTWNDECLELSWTTDLGSKGTCKLMRKPADRPSELKVVAKDWNGYKTYVSTLERKSLLFRGQNQPWRLRTAYHRSGRADLVRFLTEDAPAVFNQVVPRMKHVLNRQNPEENGAFFNLIQHHGYPTPLMDWTYSPYVAAFFAYRGITNVEGAADPDAKVRIVVFDQSQWSVDFRQTLHFNVPFLHFSVMQLLAIENERFIPQQASHTLSNIDDIETYVQTKTSESQKEYLWAIDLPISERKHVVRELRYMGITAASLFPGLDGTCEELKDRHFET
jgi:FRG domain